MNAKELRKILDKRLSDEDLRELCFELEIDYDDLLGSNRRSKIRELIVKYNRNGALAEVIAAAVEAKPGLEVDFSEARERAR